MKKLAIILILVIVLPFTAFAVAFDASSEYCSVGAATHHNWPHTTGAGATAIIINGNTGGQVLKNVDFNGSASSTYIWDILTNRNFAYYTPSPSIGSYNVNVVMGASDNLTGNAISVTGSATTADLVGDFATTSGSGTSAIINVTTTRANSMNEDSITIDNTISSLGVTGSNQTLREQQENCLAFFSSGVSTQPATSTGSFTMSWSWTTSRSYRYGANEIREAIVGAVLQFFKPIIIYYD